MNTFFKCLLLIVLTSCGANSLEDFQTEGQAIVASLTYELESIQTRDELIKKKGVLKKYFNSLVKVIIRARQYQRSHPETRFEDLSAFDFSYSNQLKDELNRIYQLDQGKELIESYEKEALEKLDNYEKRGH